MIGTSGTPPQAARARQARRSKALRVMDQTLRQMYFISR